MATKTRIDPSAAFLNIIGNPQQNTEPQESSGNEQQTQRPVTTTVGRKTDTERKIQVSIYLTTEQNRKLSIQGAMKEKEADKSAIARVGIDIALGLSVETYLALKDKAEKTNRDICEIVEEILAEQL